jgi:hypothetical protein
MIVKTAKIIRFADGFIAYVWLGEDFLESGRFQSQWKAIDWLNDHHPDCEGL